MIETRLTRRAVTGLIAAGLAAPTARASDRIDPRHRRVLEAVGPRASAAVIGAAYLRANPQEAETAGLLEALDAAGVALSGIGFGRRRALLASLDRAARRDFATGKTVRLQGWVLSVTELRAYALVALADRTV